MELPRVRPGGLRDPRLLEALDAAGLHRLGWQREVVDGGVRRAPAQLAPAGTAVSRGAAGLAALVGRIPASRAGHGP